MHTRNVHRVRWGSMTESRKRCSRCQETKDVVWFDGHPHHSDGLRSECKACRAVYRRKHYIANRETQLEIDLTRRLRKNALNLTKHISSHKVCKTCGDEKTRDLFVGSLCRDCMNTARRAEGGLGRLRQDALNLTVHIPSHKTCIECEQTKLLSEFRSRLGLKCMACLDESQKRYYEDHKEELLANSKKWLARNPDRQQVYNRRQRQQRANNPERERVRSRESYQRNKVRAREYGLRYYADNRERCLEIGRIWKQKNPDYGTRWLQSNQDKTRGYAQLRRSRRAGLECSLTREQWDAALERFGYACAYCNKPAMEAGCMTQEHFIPVVKGGGYAADNIIPACQQCNSRKGARTYEEWNKMCPGERNPALEQWIAEHGKEIIGENRYNTVNLSTLGAILNKI